MGYKPMQALRDALAALPFYQAFLDLCQANAVAPHLVGGVIRQYLLTGELSHDIDVVAPVDQVELLATLLAQKIEGRAICLDSDNKIYRVVVLETPYFMDIAGCMGPDIGTDLARRDITINAMAMAAFTGQLFDPFEGQVDLQQRRIRMISEQNFLDDPLRLLRVFRFAATCSGFTIEADTLNAVKAHVEKVIRVSPERIHYEWMLLLSAPQCADVLYVLRDVGMLDVLFPELAAMWSVPGNGYHHLGLYDHTLELFRQFEAHEASLPKAVTLALAEPVTPFYCERAVLRLACLFHDVGKPATMGYNPETDRYTFYGHDRVSANITAGIALRYKWGNALTQRVCQLVRWHLYLGEILKPGVGDKAKRKCFARLDAVMPMMVALSVADRFSAQGSAISVDELAAFKQDLFALWHEFVAFTPVLRNKPKLMSGEAIMALTGLSPGPEVGQWIEKLEEAYLNGDVQTAQEAQAWLLGQL